MLNICSLNNSNDKIKRNLFKYDVRNTQWIFRTHKKPKYDAINSEKLTRTKSLVIKQRFYPIDNIHHSFIQSVRPSHAKHCDGLLYIITSLYRPTCIPVPIEYARLTSLWRLSHVMLSFATNTNNGVKSSF